MLEIANQPDQNVMAERLFSQDTQGKWWVCLKCNISSGPATKPCCNCLCIVLESLYVHLRGTMEIPRRQGTRQQNSLASQLIHLSEFSPVWTCISSVSGKVSICRGNSVNKMANMSVSEEIERCAFHQSGLSELNCSQPWPLRPRESWMEIRIPEWNSIYVK